MALRIEQPSDTVWIISNGNTRLLEINGNNVVVGSGATLKIGADAFLASPTELNALDGIGVTATIALAAGASNAMTITVTVKDAAGATVAAVHQLELWMSEATTGIGLTADAYSGDLVASTGAIHSALTAKKHWSVVTAASGVFVAALTDSAKPADQYVAMKKPLGAALVVSAASSTSWGA